MRLAKRSRAKFLKDAIELRLFEKYVLSLKHNHKYKFFVQPGDRIANHTTVQGLFELYEIESIAHIIDNFVNHQPTSNNVVALDIGANVGSYSVALADKFKCILAFEPNPYVFKVLEANIYLNRTHNVLPYQIALGDKNEVLNLYESEEWNIGMASLTQYSEHARVISSAKVSVGDEFIPPLMTEGDVIGFVKIDVEGHEKKVISGLRKILAQHKPLIGLEISGGEVGAELKKDLREIGYEHFYWIERRKSSAVASKFRRFIDLAYLGADFYLQPVDKLENTFYSSVIASTKKIL